MNEHSLDEEHQQRFRRFIREVSPGADPTSIVVAGLLMRTSNLLVQAMERDLEHSGLTSAKFRLLTHLHRCEEHGQPDGLHPSELSVLQGISRNTVSALISSLEKDGMISRELHGTDRRRFVIRITPEGRKVLKAELGRHFEFVSQCFEGLSSNERRTLSDLLNKFNERQSRRMRPERHGASSES